MSDGLSFHLFTQPFEDAMAEVSRTTDRTTMYALRATGRAMARVAKSRAPVYEGPDPRATAESGNLRKSIKNSRRITRLGVGDYSMKVGPFGSKKKGTAVSRYGNHKARASTIARRRAAGGKNAHRTTSGELRGVPLYRRQMEEKYGFMAAGVAMGEASIREILESALAKGYERFR